MDSQIPTLYRISLHHPRLVRKGYRPRQRRGHKENQIMRRLWLVFAQTVTVCVAILFVVKTLNPQWLSHLPSSGASFSEVATVIEAPASSESHRPGSYADAANKAIPAVVHIFTSQEVKASRHPFINDPVYASNTIVDGIAVPVRRLDGLLPVDSLKGESWFLKADRQGSDLEVLGGALELLKVPKALQFELAAQRLHSEVPSHLEMLGMVEAMGFCLSGLFPISMDQNVREVEFDCVMMQSPPKFSRI